MEEKQSRFVESSGGIKNQEASHKYAVPKNTAAKAQGYIISCIYTMFYIS